jgi:dihydroneopterin aldolase
MTNVEANPGVADVLDQITVTGIRVHANHGVFDYEKADGQEFIVDVTVWLDLRAAAKSDDLEATVHYGVLAEKIAESLRSEPVDLIETVAERLAGVALSFPAVARTQITLHKPSAPIPLEFSDVFVTINRSRS